MISFDYNIDFTKKNKYAMIISLIVMILSIVLILTKGVNLGIDFVGGKRLDISIDKNIPISNIKDVIDSTHIYNNYTIKKIESFNKSIFPTKHQNCIQN